MRWRSWSWSARRRVGAGRGPTVLTLAGLVGFVGLLATTLAPVLLVLWAGLEAVAVRRAAGSGPMSRACGAAVGRRVGARGVLAGGWQSALGHPGWLRRPRGWRWAGTYTWGAGGCSVRSTRDRAAWPCWAWVRWPWPALAALLARRDRLVVALAVGAGALLLAALPLTYAPVSRRSRAH